MDRLPISLLYTPPDGHSDPACRIYTTPYDLFRDAQGLSALLAVAGEMPALFSDGTAPDYDKLEALCRLLALMPGHPLRQRIPALLRQGFGWLGNDRAPDPVTLWRLLTDHLSPASAPHDLTLSALAERMGASFPDPSRCAVVFLPPAYHFSRPDPYHAEQYRKARDAGQPLPPEAQDLLVSQQVRETAEACLAGGRELELVGTGAELEKLAAYLADQRRLPPLTCTLIDPESGEAPPALPGGVRVALCLSGSASPAALMRGLTACAIRMPLLALDGLRLTISATTDLGQIPILRESLQVFLKGGRS